MSELLLYSWNVNGIRAQEKKGFINWLLNSGADIVGLQETKSHAEQLSEALLHPDGYKSYWKSGDRKGYSGVAIYSRLEPKQIILDFEDPILNAEGRLIGLEFDKFYFFNGYFPNGGQGMHRVEYKIDFYNRFENYLSKLDKPVIFCGDINTAHNEIDLARPNENRNTSGFMNIERAWLHHILGEKKFIDTFRHFYPEQAAYSWWDMKTRARERNVGWRIDYFITSPELAKNLIDAQIDSQTLGSDHAPIWLKLKI
ncbi:exodeoxyribonuclease III [Candidatus Peregrinibacteria bacterium]|nr:exodeoxyribonuclease III [Candidatus Peregrinibacteria bacterium]